jgi:hypothetical protein
MLHTSVTRCAGLLRFRGWSLKPLLSGAADQQPTSLKRIQRILQRIPLDCVADAGAVGFVLLRVQGPSAWRVPAYVWSEEGLSRVVVEVDPATGVIQRALTPRTTSVAFARFS